MQSISSDTLARLAASSAGQALLQQLRRQDSQALDRATQAAKSGNTAGALNALNALLSDPQTAALLQRLGEDLHE